MEDYQLFLKIKSMPRYKFVGRTAEFPNEYASMLDLRTSTTKNTVEYEPIDGLFDYQEAIARLAIRKRKFAIFAEPGLGKTLMLAEHVRHANKVLGKSKRCLLVSPLMVINQTMGEVAKWYGNKLPIEVIPASRLQSWLNGSGGGIGITNYEAIREDLEPGNLGYLGLDESSYLKSLYGKWGVRLLYLGKGLDWKLSMTGTPAPNDRIEYANQAVFMDAFPTVNSFLAKYFVNRGQTDNRWELKPHAQGPFYRSLSHWCIFLTNPATYGWKDNVGNIPPIHTHIHNVDLTSEQWGLLSGKSGGFFFGDTGGGITSRSVRSQISKGNHKGKAVATNKPEFIRKLVESWPDESTIIWCLYNKEQEMMERTFPGAASLHGSTSYDVRLKAIEDFKAGRKRVLISKPKILGFGLNLQIATRQVFSGLQDSFESFFQCVKRSNRVGSKLPLNVHIPVTVAEKPMVSTVLVKAHRVQKDTEIQERLFKEFGFVAE